MKKPNFFIVGQLKSGTTALYSFLDQHSDIYMSEKKEPHYFSKDFHKECDSFHKEKKYYFRYREEEEYLQLFSNAKEEKVVGEASTSYINSNIAAKEIYNFNPNAKIIIMLRNPVGLIYSFHAFLLAETYEDVEDLRTALSLEEKRRQGEYLPPRVYLPSSVYYSEMVKYYDKVKRYYDVFGESNIKVIIFEDFKENNQKIFKETLTFLGVDNEFVPNCKMVNVRMKSRSNKLNFLAHNPFLIETIRGILPRRYYSTFTQLGRNILLKEESHQQPMDTLLKEELMRKYKSEVTKISKLLGVDLEEKWYQVKRKLIN